MGVPRLSLQFAIGLHIGALLTVRSDEELSSTQIAQSVNAELSFVRKSISRLTKAGLLQTTRGKNGMSVLARPAEEITLRDIYHAVLSPLDRQLHPYPVFPFCPVSRNIKSILAGVQDEVDQTAERLLSGITLREIADRIHQRDRRLPFQQN